MFTKLLATATVISIAAVSPVFAQSTPSVGKVITRDTPVVRSDLEACTLLRPSASTGRQWHTVAPGETLFGIAQKYYGVFWPYEELRKNNNREFDYYKDVPNGGMTKIGDDYLIRPGQRIPIPPMNAIINIAGPRVPYRPLGQFESAPLSIRGSGTLFPIGVAASICYVNASLLAIPAGPQFKGDVLVDGEGTRAGLRRLCGGDADVATASDRFTEAETRALCPTGTALLEFTVARDAVVVVISRKNAMAKGQERLSVKSADICRVFEANDLRAQRHIPTLNSGTARFFGRELCKDEGLLDRLDGNADPSVHRSEDYEKVAATISADAIAIGIVGFAFYARYAAELTLLAPDGVEPSAKNVNLGLYPLTRSLFLYATPNSIAKPHVFNWVNFTVSGMATMLEKIAFFPVAETVREASEALLRKVPQSGR